MISDKFRLAVMAYRARGGRLYQLAYAHGMSPSLLSATLTGARRVDDDDRVRAIGATLGLEPDECFEREAAS